MTLADFTGEPYGQAITAFYRLPIPKIENSST
jgi:hypothetical protein